MLEKEILEKQKKRIHLASRCSTIFFKFLLIQDLYRLQKKSNEEIEDETGFSRNYVYQFTNGRFSSEDKILDSLDQKKIHYKKKSRKGIGGRLKTVKIQENEKQQEEN